MYHQHINQPALSEDTFLLLRARSTPTWPGRSTLNQACLTKFQFYCFLPVRFIINNHFYNLLVKAMFALSTLWCLAALTVFPKGTPPSLFPTALGHHLVHNGGLPFGSYGSTVNPLPTPSFVPVEFDLLPAFLTGNLLLNHFFISNASNHNITSITHSGVPFV